VNEPVEEIIRPLTRRGATTYERAMVQADELNVGRLLFVFIVVL
jgi:hypothetical protein